MNRDDTELTELPSKSQLKREARAVTDIGRQLIELGAGDLAAIPLDDTLRAALDEARSIRSHGARKRQTLYVGRLLRQRDISAIEAALDALQNRNHEQTARFKRLERLRDSLLTEGDRALEQLVSDYPETDRQRVRSLLRNARREQESGKPPIAARALFKYLRALIDPG